MQSQIAKNWAIVHKAAKRVVNSARRRYVLSNDEAQDCIAELVVQFASYADPEVVKEKGIETLEAWLLDAMRRPRVLADVVDSLRDGGLTGEVDGDLQMLDFDGYVPAPRAPGDAEYFNESRGEIRPKFSDILPAPDAEDASDSEVSVDAVLVALPADEAVLLVEYYGLQGGEPCDLRTLAERHGMRKSAMHERIQKIIEKTRTKVEESRTINSQQGAINERDENTRTAPLSAGLTRGKRRGVARGLRQGERIEQRGRSVHKAVSAAGERELPSETGTGE